MKLTTSFAIAALAVCAASAAIAQTTPAKPAVAAPAKPAVVAPAPVSAEDAKKAKSLECSKQADAKKLHGKERKAFRETCKNAA